MQARKKRISRQAFARALAALGLVAACCGFAQAQAPAQKDPSSSPSPAASASVPQAAAATGRIYQQRQKDGSILFTDRLPREGAVTERSWAVQEDPPELAEKRRERARQEAREDAQAVNERVQRQIERERERETALALERIRLAQDQAQRDAELARADRERAADSRRAAEPPLVIVVPGAARPPGGWPDGRPYPPQPILDGRVRPPRQPEVRPAPARPAPTLCGSRTAADCNTSGDPARSGFGAR